MPYYKKLPLLEWVYIKTRSSQQDFIVISVEEMNEIINEENDPALETKIVFNPIKDTPNLYQLWLRKDYLESESYKEKKQAGSVERNRLVAELNNKINKFRCDMKAKGKTEAAINIIVNAILEPKEEKHFTWRSKLGLGEDQFNWTELNGCLKKQ